MTKRFALTAEQIAPIAVGFGSCIASDRITVAGNLVGYMYREEPSDKYDSGWRFFSGEETQDYADDPANFAIYDVNTIANYDPGITPYLEAPPFSAFERRTGEAGFAAVEFPNELDL